MKQKKRTKLNLSACYEVQVHYKRPLYNKTKKIESSETAETILREFMDKKRIDHKEFFFVMLLTNANQVLGISEIAVGSSNAVNVNIKEIFQLVLLTNASGIIVAHNHPSGKLEASQADISITKKLKEASKILDVTLLDHLIITSEGFVSLFEQNKL